MCDADDDDNVLKSGVSPFEVAAGSGQTMNVRYLTNEKRTKPGFNPLPLMKPTVNGIWPRGFPLQDLHDETMRGESATVNQGSIPTQSVGVLQAVCDIDPDMDAIYRLTRELPITFETDPSRTSNLMIPMDSFSAYNAQATTHMYNAFWGLLLPVTVTPRVTDIWRAFFTQRIMHDLQLALVYTPPIVDHKRSPHDYMGDFNAEIDVYTRTGALLNFLHKEWDDDATFLPERIENLCVALYERDYIDLADVELMQEWLLALVDVGYKFPEVSSNIKPLTPGV